MTNVMMPVTRLPAAITTPSPARASAAASDSVRLTGRRSAYSTPARAISMRTTAASPAMPQRNRPSLAATLAAVVAASPGTTSNERTMVDSG